MTRAAPTSIATAGGRDRALLVIATGWGPSHGGINALNADFCLALGRLLKDTARVICLTTPVDDLVKAAIAAQGVEIVALSHVGPGNAVSVADAALKLLQGVGITQVDLIIGHDVITGPVAVALQPHLKAKVAIIHHMSYIRYQGMKTADGRKAREMEGEQSGLLKRADTVLGVGPRVYASPVPQILGGLLISSREEA